MGLKIDKALVNERLTATVKKLFAQLDKTGYTKGVISNISGVKPDRQDELRNEKSWSTITGKELYTLSYVIELTKKGLKAKTSQVPMSRIVKRFGKNK